MQRGKGKERVVESGDSSVSAPLPNALGALSLEPQPQVQVDGAHADGPTIDAETHAMDEQDDVEGEGDDEDRTELEQPELEPEPDEVEEHEAEDVDEDVDMNTDADAREVRDLMEDEDDVE